MFVADWSSLKKWCKIVVHEFDKFSQSNNFTIESKINISNVHFVTICFLILIYLGCECSVSATMMVDRQNKWWDVDSSSTSLSASKASKFTVENLILNGQKRYLSAIFNKSGQRLIIMEIILLYLESTGKWEWWVERGGSSSRT